jgi:small subunit ribosomal protein S8
MNQTDPVADLLTRIRNAQRARLETTTIPWSKLKERVVELLKQEGYLRGYEVKTLADGFMHITAELKYGDENAPAITEVRRESTPGRRLYVRKDAIPRVKNGLGIALVSTSRGVLTDREARKLGVGGELLATLW